MVSHRGAGVRCVRRAGGGGTTCHDRGRGATAVMRCHWQWAVAAAVPRLAPARWRTFVTRRGMASCFRVLPTRQMRVHSAPAACPPLTRPAGVQPEVPATRGSHVASAAGHALAGSRLSRRRPAPRSRAAPPYERHCRRHPVWKSTSCGTGFYRCFGARTCPVLGPSARRRLPLQPASGRPTKPFQNASRVTGDKSHRNRPSRGDSPHMSDGCSRRMCTKYDSSRPAHLACAGCHFVLVKGPSA